MMTPMQQFADKFLAINLRAMGTTPGNSIVIPDQLSNLQ
jgi:hypothetical protein